MKKLLKVAVAAFMIISLGACASNSNNDGETEKQGSSYDLAALNGTNITIWHTFTNDQKDTLEAIAKEFNETNEYGIKVNVESQEYSGFTDTVYNNVTNGTGPDMMLNYASEVVRYMEDELVADVSGFIADSEIGIANYESEKTADIRKIEQGFAEEGQYIIVTQLTGPVQIINKTIYDELGLKPATNWEELEANAKAITAAKGVPGMAYDSLTDCVQIYLRQHGANIITSSSTELDADDAILKEALDYFKRGVDGGYFALMPTNDYFSADLTAGGVAAYIGSCAGAPYVEGKGIFGESDSQELEFAPVPLEGDGWNTAWDRGLIIFDYEDENRVLASYLFAKFFTTTENSLKWVQNFSALSPYASVNELSEYQSYVAGNASLQALKQQIGTASELPNIVGTSQIRNFLKNEVSAYANGQKDLDTTIADLKAETANALAGK